MNGYDEEKIEGNWTGWNCNSHKQKKCTTITIAAALAMRQCFNTLMNENRATCCAEPLATPCSESSIETRPFPASQAHATWHSS